MNQAKDIENEDMLEQLQEQGNIYDNLKDKFDDLQEDYGEIIDQPKEISHKDVKEITKNVIKRISRDSDPEPLRDKSKEKREKLIKTVA